MLSSNNNIGVYYMSCCHHYEFTEGCDTAFTIDPATITFGRGCLTEAGDRAQAMGMKRVALFTDKRLAVTPHVEKVRQSLLAAGIDVVVYDEVKVEPTDKSFIKAAEFAQEANPDGFISVGGGSVIDTCKAANLYATHPAAFLTYVNAPVGDGQPVPGPLRPHIACPTTSGTGSEGTGIAVFDYLAMEAKTGIASKHMRPDQALVDPDCTASLPASVVAASGFDVLSHALESYTASPYTQRPAPGRPSLRPASQGANPWSDMGCAEALRLTGRYLDRAVADANDTEAREQMMWAATLAGLAFGNCGVHAPHGMAYAVAGLVRDFQPVDYPDDEPMVPHGMSVIVNAPAVFRHTAQFVPERHLAAADWLGADCRGATLDDAGEVVAKRIIALMQTTGIPNGLSGVGYNVDDIEALTEGTFPQQRLLKNAPMEITKPLLAELFNGAISYW